MKMNIYTKINYEYSQHQAKDILREYGVPYQRCSNFLGK